MRRGLLLGSLLFVAGPAATGCGDSKIPDVSRIRSEVVMLRQQDQDDVCSLQRAWNTRAVAQLYYQYGLGYYEKAQQSYNRWLEDLAYSIQSDSKTPVDNLSWQTATYWSGVLRTSGRFATAARVRQATPPPPPPPTAQYNPYSSQSSPYQTPTTGSTGSRTFAAAELAQGSEYGIYIEAGKALVAALPTVQELIHKEETISDEKRKQRADDLRAVEWPTYQQARIAC